MPTFGDASFYIALADPRDPWHDKAVALLDLFEARAPVHSTAFVLAEVVAAVGSRCGGKAAMTAYETITEDGVLLVPTRDDIAQSMRTVLRYDGKLSLADAYTLHAMAEAGAKDLFSFDKDFEGKGVHRLTTPAKARGS